MKGMWSTAKFSQNPHREMPRIACMLNKIALNNFFVKTIDNFVYTDFLIKEVLKAYTIFISSAIYHKRRWNKTKFKGHYIAFRKKF